MRFAASPSEDHWPWAARRNTTTGVGGSSRALVYAPMHLDWTIPA